MGGRRAFGPRGRRSEKPVSKQTKIEKKPSNQYDSAYTGVTWVTIEAKNRSYTGWYVDIRDTIGEPGTADDNVTSRRTSGIKCVSKGACNRYQHQYLKLQHSLEQFADA